MSLMRVTGCVVASLALAIFTGSARAQAPYFQGKQVKVLVGFSPGGGTDLFGRLMAEPRAKPPIWSR
jgi:tripartite-type tricarboxylate transporter receptor subunit TctC